MYEQACESCYFGTVKDGGFWGKRVLCGFLPNVVNKEVTDWCGNYLYDDTKVDPEDRLSDDED